MKKASEVEGLIKSGGLADVAKALPKALQTLEQDVRVTIPAYRNIPNIDSAEVILSTELDHWPHTAYQVKKLSVEGVPVLVTLSRLLTTNGSHGVIGKIRFSGAIPEFQ